MLPLSRARLWAELLLISALWGSSFPLMRHVAGVMPPLALATARGAFAALAVGLFLWWRGALRWPGRRSLRHILVIGTVNGWLPNVLTALALRDIESAPAALIQSATPLLVGVMAFFLLREERPGPRMALGLGLGFLGIAVILGPRALDGGATIGAALLMLGTAASYAAGTVYMRWARPEEAGQLVMGQQVMAVLIAGTLGLAFGAPGGFAQPASIWLSLVVLGVFASAVPLSLYVLLLRRARATEAAMVGYLEPPFAALVAAFLLSEIPEPRVALGGAVVLLGVWLATRR
ncbi:DMT family transporter [Teichococcus aestuarii]|uniref:DMT family transporter n=1 Tax=Teichococcus aestuarii TaxID=568898 RepID=UPI0036111308